MTVELDEVYATGEDLYFKISGTGSVVVEGGTTYIEQAPTDATEVTETTETVEADGTTVVETETVNNESSGVVGAETSSLLSVFNMLNMVSGEWIRVPLNGSEISLNGDTTEGSLGCTVSLVSGVRNNSRTVANIYSTHPFVMTAADQKTTIASAGNPVYRAIVDANGFADFASELESSNVLNDWTTCMGDKNASAAIESLVEAAGNLPEIYVEIDDDYNFTRLYFATEIWGEEDCCPDGAECLRACNEELKETVTVDLNFTYPSSVDASEPTEYRDLSDVMQGSFSEMYVTDATGEKGSSDTGGEGPQG